MRSNPLTSQKNFTSEKGATPENFLKLVGKNELFTILIEGTGYELNVFSAEEDKGDAQLLVIKGRYWYTSAHSRGGIDDEPFTGRLNKKTMTGWIKPI